MERSFLETIQSLGLDIQLGIILLMFAIDGLATLGRRIAAWRAAQPVRGRRRGVATRPSAATDAQDWSSGSVTASGG